MGVCDRHSLNRYKMELRSYNVERVYKDCVRCRIGNDLGVNKPELLLREAEIKSMIKQIARSNGKTILSMANLRTDGETWTPYLQIVEMLILLGAKIGVLSFEGQLNENTIITFNDETN